MVYNIAAYKFVAIASEQLQSLCKELKGVASLNSIKGTILLATEGINLFLAGTKEDITRFQAFLNQNPLFCDLHYKLSYCDFVPFKKLSVKVKDEIVTFKCDGIQPEKLTAPYVSPDELKQWYQQKRDMIVLDTRNNFEYQIGAFEQAVNLNINHFREFPAAVHLSMLDKNKPIVTYCTGGIRCEKASAYLLNHGFKQVYQLQGGILGYFEQCGGQYYRGNCFVFDDRIALNSKLEVI